MVQFHEPSLTSQLLSLHSSDKLGTQSDFSFGDPATLRTSSIGDKIRRCPHCFKAHTARAVFRADHSDPRCELLPPYCMLHRMIYCRPNSQCRKVVEEGLVLVSRQRPNDTRPSFTDGQDLHVGSPQTHSLMHKAQDVVLESIRELQVLAKNLNMGELSISLSLSFSVYLYFLPLPLPVFLCCILSFSFLPVFLSLLLSLSLSPLT